MLNQFNNRVCKHYKDLSFGLEGTKRVWLDEGDFQFVNSNFLTWCDSIAKISQLFMNAELKSRLQLLPTRACLGFSDYYRSKFKEEDLETRLERLEFIVQKMKPPRNGLYLSLYEIKDEYIESYEGYEGFKITWPFHTLFKWPMIDTWSGGDGNYVSFQKTEKLSPLVNDKEHMRIEDSIINDLVKHDVEIKFISYDQTSKYVYDTILNSKYHISYAGASWWLAHSLDVPVYTYGKRYEPNRDLWGYHSSGIMNHGLETHVPVQLSGNKFVNKRVTGDGWELYQNKSIVADLSL